ncbi:hypothetical protein PHLGIDRAFT_131188 [Phlebiopsis gigantea 11061_1 CR5-6]|uniref:Cytochrome P450 n=1 Tax=Phlebiopsis gigantea (strain 11061_1 CR5-6) TaxID=745531 RepID=A0A0C3RZ26_PHLG1|nr:hypothetical protein PHLGIDRAFT_131188 [Phlebiopsis gigantea 11061_1 CR5-6]
MAGFLQLASLGLGLWLVRRALYVYKAIRNIRGIPVYISLIEPSSICSAFFPKGTWNPRITHAWDHQERYDEMGAEAILFVPLFFGVAVVHSGSPELNRQLYTDIKTWPKPARALNLNFMGENLLTLNGEDWRKHRKITAPAFDSQIYADVWKVTTNLYCQMMNSEAWKSGDQHYFDNFNDITTRLALLVIAACGFNMNVPWDGPFLREGFEEPLDSVIVRVCKVLLPRIVFPDWIWKAPIKGVRELQRSFLEMQRFLDLEIEAKRKELSLEKEHDTAESKNLFSRVVLASQTEGAKGLTHEEIRGNLFIYLFAGHETTAHTLVTALALLAAYQDEQERVYRHIMSVAGDRDMEYADYSDLTPVLHCFYEALRLYPLATNSLRIAAEDTSITAPGLTKDGNNTVFIGKGFEVIVDMVGSTRNARNFPDPIAFKPRRWESADTAVMENFMAFSAGPRLCLGRKFSTVESVCFLSNVLRDWRFDAKLEEGETATLWLERVMKPDIGVTLKIDNTPLLVTRR